MRWGWVAADLMALWSVYVLRTRLDTLYTGITTDVERRLSEHGGQTKQGAKSLRSKGPLTLEYQAQVGDRSLASQVEYGIKQLSKAEKEALIRQQPNSVQLLDSLDLMVSEESA